MAEAHDVQMRRIYDDPADDDGIRVLVDRRWPRGVSKARAELDEWCTRLLRPMHCASGTDMCPRSSTEFEERYRQELEDPERASALRYLRADGLPRPLDPAYGHQAGRAQSGGVLAEILRD